MRLIINLILIALVAVLAWVLYESIREPIAFKAEKDKREAAVQNKLTEIRTAQEMYRDITGEFAPNFDTLAEVLTTGKFALVSVFGDPDDPNFDGVIRYDTTYSAAIDSVQAMGMSLDSLRYIPYTANDVFDIKADTMTYQSTLVHVVEVGTRLKNFMGDFSDPRFSRYDNSYDPNEPVKFGDMNKPTLAGSW